MSRTKNRLTAKEVAGLRKDGYYADGDSLYLRIQGRARAWVIIKVKNKQRSERRIGDASVMSLKEARELRDNPPKPIIEVKAMPTFGAYADEVLESLLPGFKNAKHRQQWENTLKTHGASLRKIPVDELSTDDVLAVLRPIWLSLHETARRLRGRIERILGAAKAAGLRPQDSMNPAAWDDHLEHFLPKAKMRKRGHHKAMAFADLPEFMARLRDLRSTSARSLEWLILTWTRTGETRGAQVKEVDVAAGTWTIPPARMKMGVEHVVPLGPRALQIFEEMCVGMRPDDFLFPGAKKGKPLSQMAMLELLRGMEGMGATVHGFRSAARDWAGDATDFPREVAEMALAHAVGDAVEQAYRRGKALDKRRELMLAWEKFVVTKPRRRAKAA